ncbi:hypothetical protein DRO03_07345 [Methanosarcinales archaeon]|nr:MAG: hypothetical protein DRO03_07345 [Methanosarcinales archaeon]
MILSIKIAVYGGAEYKHCEAGQTCAIIAEMFTKVSTGDKKTVILPDLKRYTLTFVDVSRQLHILHRSK